MIYVLITLLVIPSPVLMMISSEAIAVALALQGEPPLLISLSLSTGQTIGFSLIYVFGEWLSQRSERLQRGLDRLDVERLQHKAPHLITFAAVFGLPPLNVSCVAISALKLRFTPLVPLIFFGRLTRYFFVASIPSYFVGYVDLSWLPDWLTLSAP